jgi:hypothetical protein
MPLFFYYDDAKMTTINVKNLKNEIFEDANEKIPWTVP